MSKILTPEFRLSFPNLWEPKLHKLAKPGDKPKYGLVMLFPKTTDLSAMKAFAKADMDARLGPTFSIASFNKTAAAKNIAGFKTPFMDGDAQDQTGYAGCIFVRASSLTKPGIVGPDVVAIIDPSEIYAGCYCRATVDAYSWNNETGAGIRFGLLNVQKTRDGEPFGNRGPAENDFAVVAAAQGAKPQAAQQQAPRTTVKSPAQAAAVDDWNAAPAGAGEPNL